MRRLTLTDGELAVLAEALREATRRRAAGAQLPRASRASCLTASTPSCPARPTTTRPDPRPAGCWPATRFCGSCCKREDRHGHAALTNEAIAGELSWKPAGTSVRELLEDLRRGGWLTCTGNGPDREFALTRKGRGRARALHAGTAPDHEARVSEPDELLDLIYADSTPCALSSSGDVAERVPGVWHRPTVQAAARLNEVGFSQLEAALREAGLIGAQVHSYGTLTPTGEQHARARWQASRPVGAFGGPPRLARPYRRAHSVDRARAGSRPARTAARARPG